MLNTVEDRVKCLLYRLPKARDNDMYLICVYFANFMGSTDLKDFKDNPTNIFESIGRCRRKLQKEIPELKPSKEVQEARQKKKEEYLDYSMNIVK